MLLADTNKGATGFHMQTGPNVSGERSVYSWFGPLYDLSVLHSVATVPTTGTCQSVEGKGKFYPKQATKAQRGSTSIALLFL
jgi:hypothetical protein